VPYYQETEIEFQGGAKEATLTKRRLNQWKHVIWENDSKRQRAFQAVQALKAMLPSTAPTTTTTITPTTSTPLEGEVLSSGSSNHNANDDGGGAAVAVQTGGVVSSSASAGASGRLQQCDGMDEDRGVPLRENALAMLSKRLRTH